MYFHMSEVMVLKGSAFSAAANWCNSVNCRDSAQKWAIPQSCLCYPAKNGQTFSSKKTLSNLRAPTAHLGVICHEAKVPRVQMLDCNPSISCFSWIWAEDRSRCKWKAQISYNTWLFTFFPIKCIECIWCC